MNKRTVLEKKKKVTDRQYWKSKGGMERFFFFSSTRFFLSDEFKKPSLAAKSLMRLNVKEVVSDEKVFYRPTRSSPLDI
jgi:hypothetical protein